MFKYLYLIVYLFVLSLSLPNTLSSNNKYWNDVIIDLEQDNYNNVQPYMDYLRKQMRKVEDLYFDRNLSKEPPTIEIESN